MDTVLKGKIPKLRILMGDPKTIFAQAQQRGAEMPNVNIAEEIDRRVYQRPIDSLDVSLNNRFVTLKASAILENTRLYNQHDPNLDHFVTWYNSIRTVQAYSSDTPAASLDFKPLTATSRSFFVSKDDGNYVMFRSTEDGIYSEVAPERHPQVIRIFQGATTPWATSALQSSRKLESNASFYIELELKGTPQDQGVPDTIPAGQAFIYDIAKQSTTATTTDTTVNKRVIQFGFDQGFNISGGTVKWHGLFFTFADGTSPMAILGRGAVYNVIVNRQAVCGLPQDGPVWFRVRWCPPGHYIVSSNIFKDDWIITVYDGKVTESDGEGLKIKKQFYPINIDPSYLTVQTYGLGAHTFCYCPVRYNRYSEFLVNYSTTDEVGYFNGEDGKLVVRWKAVANPYLTKVDALKNIDFATDEGIKHCILFMMSTESDFHTPYMSRMSVDDGRVPDEDVFSGEDITSGVKSITVTPVIENVMKIKLGGSITFTNFNDEWADAPALKGITIEYRYDEEEWTRIFTGYMVNPSFSRRGPQEKYCTFQLADRWFALERVKIINSDYWDGNYWITAFKTIAKLGGMLDEEILVDENLTNGTGSDDLRDSPGGYTLPYAPNVLGAPQYRFKFGTSVGEALDQLLKLVQVFCYTDEYGRISLVDINRVITDEPETYYSNLEDVPEDEEGYNILSSYVFNKDSESIHNVVMVQGVNWDALNQESFVLRQQAVDWDSILDVDASNYMGVPIHAFISHTWLANQRDVNDFAIKMLDRVSTPVYDVSWTVPYYEPRKLYQPIKFVDSKGDIPDEDPDTGGDFLFWLVGNEFSYDSTNLRIQSKLQAKRLRGLLHGLVRV